MNTKPILTIIMDCIDKHETTKVNTISLGFQPTETEKGLISSKIFTYQTIDLLQESEKFVPGKKYSIAILEVIEDEKS